MLIIAIISIIATVIMTGAILLQNPKSGGAGPMMGGNSQVFGHKQTSDFLEKTTWVGVSVLFLVCITYSLLQTGDVQVNKSVNIEKAKSAKVDQAPLQQPAPAAPAQGGTTEPAK